MWKILLALNPICQEEVLKKIPSKFLPPNNDPTKVEKEDFDLEDCKRFCLNNGFFKWGSWECVSINYVFETKQCTMYDIAFSVAIDVDPNPPRSVKYVKSCGIPNIIIGNDWKS